MHNIPRIYCHHDVKGGRFHMAENRNRLYSAYHPFTLCGTICLPNWMEPQCPRWPPPTETLLAEVRLVTWSTCMWVHGVKKKVDMMVEGKEGKRIFSAVSSTETSNKLNRLCVTSQSQCGRLRKLRLFLSGRLRVGGVNVDRVSGFHLYNAALVAFSPTDSMPHRLHRSARPVCAWLIARLYNNVRRRDSSFNLHYLHEGTACYCIWRHTHRHTHTYICVLRPAVPASRGE